MQAYNLVELTKLYLRLNGFLSITNFIVHPPDKRTDVDILAVRFPFQREDINGDVLPNDPTLCLSHQKIEVVLVEVKSSKQCINRSWRNPEVVKYVLGFLGYFHSESCELACASERLARKQPYETDSIRIKVMLFTGNQRACQSEVVRRLDSALEFVYNRFKEYKTLKADHSMWEGTLAGYLFDRVDADQKVTLLDIKSLKLLTIGHE
jgi:hypothetical protein